MLAREQLGSNNAPIEHNVKNKGVICTWGHLVETRSVTIKAAGPVKRDQGVVGTWPRPPPGSLLEKVCPLGGEPGADR